MRPDKWPWDGENVELELDSVWYSDPVESSASEGMYRRMFIEDVSDGVFPYDGENESGVVVVSVEPPGARERALVGRAFSGRVGDRRSYGEMERAVCEWARGCARAVIAEGGAAYELGRMRVGGVGEAVAMVAVPMRYRDLSFVAGTPVQTIPAGCFVSDPGDGGGPHSLRSDAKRYLRASRVVSVALSNEWESARRVPSKLGDIDRELVPSFAPGGKNWNPKSPSPFRFDVFRRTELVAMARGAAPTGWMGRGTAAGSQTGYYVVWKYLQLERFKCALREAVMAGAARIVAAVGQELDVKLDLRWMGLPTVEMIDEAERELADGVTSASDLVRRFRV